MALSGLSVYEIDFYVLENNNPKTLVIFDQSNYLDIPEQPVYSIKLPGYSKGFVVPYQTGQINVLNSNTIGLTTVFCVDDLADLPDGIYEITQMVCPYDELFKTKNYLKTTKLECLYKTLLLNLDVANSCLGQSALEKEIIKIDILIQSAKAEIERHNKKGATDKYAAAMDKIHKLNNKLNCGK